ncbi:MULTISPECIES: hypothetical protein, partial [unclassified Ruegeria]|uniref:hypothetical protein n=1 Tax=unclassified Ruegeria TaxID=2625375 RepID=UPI001AE1CF54
PNTNDRTLEHLGHILAGQGCFARCHLKQFGVCDPPVHTAFACNCLTEGQLPLCDGLSLMENL